MTIDTKAAIACLLAGGFLLLISFGAWRLYAAGQASARPGLEAKADQVVTSSQETIGARQSAQRVDVVVTQTRAADAAVYDLAAAAMTSEDAHAPLNPDRAARLRHADGELCRISPDLDGCAAAAN